MLVPYPLAQIHVYKYGHYHNTDLTSQNNIKAHVMQTLATSPIEVQENLNHIHSILISLYYVHQWPSNPQDLGNNHRY